MEKAKNKNLKAFSSSASVGLEGLTKREYFAAMAMQGILSNSDLSYLPASRIADKAVSHANVLLRLLDDNEQHQ